MKKYPYYDMDVIRGWVNQQVASFCMKKLFDYPPPPYFSEELKAKGTDKKMMDRFWFDVIEKNINKYWKANGDPSDEFRRPGVWDFPCN